VDVHAESSASAKRRWRPGKRETVGGLFPNMGVVRAGEVSHLFDDRRTESASRRIKCSRIQMGLF